MFLKKKPNQQKNVRNIEINITHVKLKTKTKQTKISNAQINIPFQST